MEGLKVEVLLYPNYVKTDSDLKSDSLRLDVLLYEDDFVLCI